jgi:hypothetical protein
MCIHNIYIYLYTVYIYIYVHLIQALPVSTELSSTKSLCPSVVSGTPLPVPRLQGAVYHSRAPKIRNMFVFPKRYGAIYTIMYVCMTLHYVLIYSWFKKRLLLRTSKLSHQSKSDQSMVRLWFGLGPWNPVKYASDLETK